MSDRDSKPANVSARTMPPPVLSAEAAMGGLPNNSPDWLRAQDIALVARARLEEERRRGRRNPDQR